MDALEQMVEKVIVAALMKHDVAEDTQIVEHGDGFLTINGDISASCVAIAVVAALRMRIDTAVNIGQDAAQ